MQSVLTGATRLCIASAVTFSGVLVLQVARPLEGGRQCMIWPAHCGLRADGQLFVIDPYSQGAMYSQAEVIAQA